jgi:MerR family transcriptional regulator, copper efflux regulator
MNISQAATETGLPPKTIRYYEDIGLLSPARQANGYRSYGGVDIHRLRFLQRARSLGFSVEDCRTLLSLYGDQDRASAEVKAIALRHLDSVRRKIAELKSLEKTLSGLVHACHGDALPDCPILDELAEEGRGH